MSNRVLMGVFTLAFVSVFCIVLLEVGLAVVAPVPDPYHHHLQFNQYIRSAYPPDYKLIVEPEEFLPGLSGKKELTTNNVGMRGPELVMPKPDDEYRVFMVGGSTTECGVLDDSESFDAMLSQHLNAKAGSDKVIRVYNSGVSGHKSDDHLSWMVHRIAQLDPDMVIVFAGINDLLAAISDFDYLHIDAPRHSRLLLARMVSTRFQIPRRLFYLYNRVAAPTDQEILEEIGVVTNYRRKIEVRKRSRQTDERPRTDVESYENNLRTMAGVAEGQDFQLVLMTQQSTWASKIDPEASEWHWVRCRYGTTYREDYMHEALEEYNASTLQVGLEMDIPVYDFTRDCPKSTEYFYDEIHFNEKGGAEAGRLLAEFILSKDLLPPSAGVSDVSALASTGDGRQSDD